MSPLMQAICDHLSDYCIDHYIDASKRNANAMEREQLHQSLAAALPDSCYELLDRYEALCLYQLNQETEAMFQAAFAAAKELLNPPPSSPSSLSQLSL